MKESLFLYLSTVKAGDRSSDAQWLRTVLSSGTLSDKIAALTIQIQVTKYNVVRTFILCIVYLYLYTDLPYLPYRGVSWFDISLVIFLSVKCSG